MATMREKMKEAMGIAAGMEHDASIMHDNPLALATDEQPFSMMAQEVEFPHGSNNSPGYYAGYYEDEVKLIKELQTAMTDEEDDAKEYDALSTYARSINRPDVSYVVELIRSDEKDHYKMLSQMVQSIVADPRNKKYMETHRASVIEQPRLTLNYGERVEITGGEFTGQKGMANSLIGALGTHQVVIDKDYSIQYIPDEYIKVIPPQ